VSSTHLKIRYDAGWGNRISLRGDVAPFSWERGQDLVCEEDGLWTLRWDMTDEGMAFKPLVNDRVWAIGADYHIRRGETLEINPFFYDEDGSVERFHHFDTPIVVYLPPGYHENPDRRYPVCYAHDGQNLFDPNTAFMGQIWGLDMTIAKLVKSGLIEPLIAVGVFNRGAARIHDYTPSFDPSFGAGGGAESYAQMLIEEIKPFVDLHYRTLPEPRHTALMGSSLGGLVSLFIARRRPDVFGKVASLSSSFWWNSRNMIREVTRKREHIPLEIYLDAGSRESWEETLEMYQALMACGYEAGKDLFCFIAQDHGHSERAWRERVHMPLTFLFPPQQLGMVKR